MIENIVLAVACASMLSFAVIFIRFALKNS